MLATQVDYLTLPLQQANPQSLQIQRQCNTILHTLHRSFSSLIFNPAVQSRTLFVLIESNPPALHADYRTPHALPSCFF
jgi:hypothetical protein